MPSTSYQTETKHVGQLLSSNTRERIIVPEFQRGYEWGEKHVKAFWKDLEEFQSDRVKENGPSAYFFGPIVIHQGKDEIELLDGQQRLATVTILLSVIRDAAKAIASADAEDVARDIQKQFIRKGQDYALTLGDTDSVFFREYIQNEDTTLKKAEQRTHRNIRAAREILFKVVSAAIGDSSPPQTKLAVLTSFLQIIRSDLVLASISVESDTDAFRIFETLNDRGLSLSAPDLLLNYLMKKAANKADRTVIRELWTNMVEAVGALNLNDFIRQLWVSKFGDVKKTSLFTVISEWLKENRTNPVEFARSCSEECDSYVQIVTFDEELGDAAGHIKNLIGPLGGDAAIPLFLSTYKRLDKARFLKLCQWLLVFIVRYSIMGNQDRAGLENLCFALARQSREKLVASKNSEAGQKECMAVIKKALEGNSPTNPQIMTRLDKIEISDSEAKYVILKIANLVQSEAHETEVAKASVEHIYPKNPAQDKWGGPDNHAKLEPYLWNIGNLTMLGKKLNSQRAGNDEYPAKRKIYRKESKIIMAQNIAKHYKKWDVEDILERAKHVTEKALQIWNYNNVSHV